MGQQAYSDLPNTKHVTTPISEVLGANPQKPDGIGTFKPYSQNTSMRVNGLNVIKGNYSKPDSGAGREIKVGNEQLPTDNLSITIARRLGTIRFSPQEATKCVILLSKLDNFDFTNILEYKQLNYEASDIIDIMQAKLDEQNRSLSDKSILRTVGGENGETISEKSEKNISEVGYVANLGAHKTQVIENLKDEDINAKSFSKWNTRHHVSIITRSNNKGIATEIKPISPLEKTGGASPKIARSVIRPKSRTVRASTAEGAATTIENTAAEETEAIKNSVEIFEGVAEVKSGETMIPAMSTESLSAEPEVTEVRQNQISEILGKNTLPTEPTQKATPVSSNKFMERLGMSSDIANENQVENTSPVGEIVPETEIVEEIDTKEILVTEKSLDEKALESQIQNEVTEKEVQTTTVQNETTHEQPRQLSQEVKHSAVDTLLKTFTNNGSKNWQDFIVAIKKQSVDTDISTAPKNLETLPVKSWRDSDNLNANNSAFLSDLTTA